MGSSLSLELNMNTVESLIRWIHVVAGVLWIGLLYFFNWVNGPFAATMDGETKKKVIPELLPRALYFFRWGAAFTWVTGVLLLTIVYYHNQAVLSNPSTQSVGDPNVLAMIAFTFLAVFVYDALYKGPIKNDATGFVVSVVLATISVLLFKYVGKFGPRGYAIHLGAMFGTMMAFNVWFRIWPSQQKIITAIKNGEAPDAALVGLAGLRSRHNTYMSVPLLFTMVNQHATWAYTGDLAFPLIVVLGWGTVYHLYTRAGQVKGF